MTMPFPSSSPSLPPASHTHILYLILALWLSPVVAGMESTFRHHIWRHGIHSRPQKRSLPLPVDIVDLLLDTLHHDGKVLTLCSLVSRVWLLRTRPRMFSQGVVINRTKMARLLILLKSPYCTLRPHLQKMTIDPMRDNELWLDSFFTLIAAKGISLRHLTVPNLPALRTDSSCLSMPCIVPLISLHITVSPDHGVVETMDFIYLFSSSLENLAIHGHSATVPRPIFMGIAGRHQTFPRLQNLDIDGVQSLLQYIDWFSQFVVLSSLSSLYLGLDYCGSPLYDKNEISRRINIFLNRACPNVESLFLDYGWASPVSGELEFRQPHWHAYLLFLPWKVLIYPNCIGCAHSKLTGQVEVQGTSSELLTLFAQLAPRPWRQFMYRILTLGALGKWLKNLHQPGLASMIYFPLEGLPHFHSSGM